MPIRILLVDDHSVVRQGLRMFLSLETDLEVVGEAENGAEALIRIGELSPDVVLMDLMMPVMDGIEAIKKAKIQYPDVELVALTSVLEDRSVVQAVKAGAIGYLLKDTEAGELCKAIKAAAQGKVQLSPEASARLMKALQAGDPVEDLTEREYEVLVALSEGKSNKDVADQLCVTEKTVKTHVSNVLNKLGVKSRTQAALYAWQTGLVRPGLGAPSPGLKSQF
ncbi:MAG: response regulator transcription factor [Vulcanimicrobiota bacterium]